VTRQDILTLAGHHFLVGELCAIGAFCSECSRRSSLLSLSLVGIAGLRPSRPLLWCLHPRRLGFSISMRPAYQVINWAGVRRSLVSRMVGSS
jgi:hypothetical protein